MVPGNVNENIITQRASWVLQMVDGIEDLHIENKDAFLRNRHDIAAAESYLRRALEALFDLGRHILAKRFAYPSTEYKEIANGLFEKKVLSENEAALMRKMAGYRNRMVHFYNEITPEELHDICLNHVDEVKLLLDSLIQWVNKNKGDYEP